MKIKFFNQLMFNRELVSLNNVVYLHFTHYFLHVTIDGYKKQLHFSLKRISDLEVFDF